MTGSEHVPKFDTPAWDDDYHQKLKHKHIDIDDDPTEDILCHLKDACDWIETGLQSGSKIGDDRDEHRQVGVLVHCTQGISRSGSIVVAYCKSAPGPPATPVHRRHPLPIPVADFFFFFFLKQ